MKKPEMCDSCADGCEACFCSHWPLTCKIQLTLFLMGFEAGQQKGFRDGFDQATIEAAVPEWDRPTIPVPGL